MPLDIVKDLTKINFLLFFHHCDFIIEEYQIIKSFPIMLTKIALIPKFLSVAIISSTIITITFPGSKVRLTGQ